MTANLREIQLFNLIGVRIVLVLIVLLLTGCGYSSELGADFFQPSSVDILFTDSLTLKLSTVKLDSNVTGSPSRLLIGKAVDDELGIVTASAFFEVLPADGSSDYYVESATTRFSRATVVIVGDGYSYYDTLSQSVIEVFPLSEEMEANDDGYFYNRTDFAKEAAIGSLSFYPMPGLMDTLEVPLSSQYGQRIYDAMISDPETYVSSTEIVTKIPGFMLAPKSGTSVIGISSTVQLRIYYWDTQSVPITEKYIFFSSASGEKFNQLLADRTATALNSLVSNKYALVSALSENRSYIQGGDGLCLRVEAPYLNTILYENKDLVIISATLQFSPAANTYGNNRLLPTSLVAYIVNDLNEITSQFGTTALVTDYALGRDTYYEIDVTDYVKSRLAQGESPDGSAFLFSLSDSDMSISINRLIIPDQKNSIQPKLRINFLNINKDE